MDEINIHTKFGDWIVTSEGDLINELAHFHITFDRLTEQNWMLNAITFGWDLNQFFPAYYEACALIGLDSVVFQVKHN